MCIRGRPCRGRGEVERFRAERDCLQRFRARVTEAALLEADALDAIDRSVAEDIEHSVRNAKEAPRPTEADLLTDVYVAY